MNASEKDIRTAPYGTSEVVLNAEGRDIVVLSDLHLASGINSSGNVEGTENFLEDDALARFMQHLKEKQEKQTILVINGDFIDFLRITNLPESEEDFDQWKIVLNAVGIDKAVKDLKGSISKKEKDYGLKTHDYKTVWKLHICAKGHEKTFKQLAAWLAKGNTLIIVKGNHDLEWYWEAVRKYFTHLMSALMPIPNGSATIENKAGNLYFVDDSFVISNNIHITHGHKFEKITTVDGDPTVNKGTELNLPFGSFLNRYLLNKIEVAYPYLDNIRPRPKIIPILLRERFPLAIKVLFCHLWVSLKVIPKRQYRYMFKDLLDVFIIIILPIAITAYAVITSLKINVPESKGVFSEYIRGIAVNFVFLFLSYIFGRLLSMAKLSEPDTFAPNALKIFKQNASLQIVTFGHTHNPEQKRLDIQDEKATIMNKQPQYYFNTGTWMPVYDLSAANVRTDKTFTYLSVKHDASGNIASQELLRWNDDALRSDPMILCDKKE